MDDKIQRTGNQETLIGDKFINRGIFLIILGPIIGVLSIFVSSVFVGRLVSTDGGVEALMMLGGISTVGLGISSVIVGCTKNIIQKITK
jgi:hypothetical protein